MSLLSRFFKNQKKHDRVIGLRVTDDWIRFVEILKKEQSHDDFEVGVHGLLRLPLGCVQAGRLKDPEQFFNILKQTQLDFENATISLVVPD